MQSASVRSVAGLVALCLIHLTACSDGGSHKASVEVQNCEISGQNYGIIGGQVLSSGNKLSDSTVMIIHDNGSPKQSLCTGTLIAPHRVLTAAHCTSRDFSEHTFIAFSNNVSCVSQAPKRTVRLATDRQINLDYVYSSDSPYAATNDLAILSFEGDLPTGYVVRPLPNKDYDPTKAQELVFSGYGKIDDTEHAETGTLRFTTGSTSRLKHSFYLKRNQHSYTIDKTLIVDQPENGICQGDSGGPLYARDADGTLNLIGVSSMVADTEDRDEVRLCHGISIFVDVRAKLDWIKANMQ